MSSNSKQYRFSATQPVKDKMDDQYDFTDDVNPYANTRATLFPKLKHISAKERKQNISHKKNPHSRTTKLNRSIRSSFSASVESPLNRLKEPSVASSMANLR